MAASIDSENVAGLVGQALAGDPTALNGLVAALTPVIQARVARTLLTRRYQLASGRDIREEVADLTQEIFLSLFARDARVLRSWQADRGLSLENFVGLVAKRHVLSFLGSGKRNPSQEEPFQDEDFDAPATDQDPEKITASREELHLLLDRLHEELSPLGWQLFDLLFVRELSIPEVKAASGLSDDAVYAWRSRLRKRAQRLLAEMSGNTSMARKIRKDATG
jgi:RNA polymerase sigma factor (sigma-70 family)